MQIRFVEFRPGVHAIEVTHLALILGYTQGGSIRKQIEGAWQKDFVEGVDYVYVTGLELLGVEEKYTGYPLLRSRATRGRMLILESGFDKILSRTSKSEVDAVAKAAAKVFGKLPVVDREPQEEPSPSKGSFAERRYTYEALQTLLSQLRELEDPSLRALAIASAESLLGRSLDLSGRSGVLHTASSRVTLETLLEDGMTECPGPYFEEEGFYTCAEIGEKAGHYTASQASLAARIVGIQLGYTYEEVRCTPLPFNQVRERLEFGTGKLRPSTRFNRAFSNAVIAELRRNLQCIPSPAGPMRIVPPSAESKTSGEELDAGLECGANCDDEVSGLDS